MRKAHGMPQYARACRRLSTGSLRPDVFARMQTSIFEVKATKVIYATRPRCRMRWLAPLPRVAGPMSKVL